MDELLVSNKFQFHSIPCFCHTSNKKNADCKYMFKYFNLVIKFVFAKRMCSPIKMFDIDLINVGRIRRSYLYRFKPVRHLRNTSV